MATQTLTLSDASSPATSPSQTPWRLRSPSMSPPPLAISPPEPRIISENDVLASRLIPAEQKPTIIERYRQLRFVLSTHDRTGRGFEASGASFADKLVAAEQLARMTMVYEWYVGFSRNMVTTIPTEEIESMATDMLDAALCTTGWHGSWDQPCFTSPLCLTRKEKEVAELTSWCLNRLVGSSLLREKHDVTHTEKAKSANSSPSARDILNCWHRSRTRSASDVIRKPRKQHARDLKAEISWVNTQCPGKGRSRADTALRSSGQEDLDHEVWNKLAAERPASPSASLEVEWPPEASLAGYGLMTKLMPKDHPVVSLALKQWSWETASRHIRAALHPWCLRCYRLRGQSRDTLLQSRARALLDTVFILFGILIVLVVEWYIAWTDTRVPQGAPFLSKARTAWSLVMEADIQPELYCWQRPDPPVTQPRHRAISCPF